MRWPRWRRIGLGWGLALALIAVAPAAPGGAEPRQGDFKWQEMALPGNAHLAEPAMTTDLAGSVYVSAPNFATGMGAGDAGETRSDTMVVYRSTDVGRSFTRVDLSASVQGGYDNHIDALSDGSVNAVDVEVFPLGVIAYHSTDRFTRGPGVTSQVGADQDRPWLSHLCNRLAYLAFKDATTAVEGLYRSTDAGVTWLAAPTLVSSGIGPPATAFGSGSPNPVDTVLDTHSGPVVVDQRTGAVYVAYSVSSTVDNAMPEPYGVSGTPLPNAIVVAASTDGGITFTNRYAFFSPPGTVAGPLFPGLTLDVAGTVYVTWAGNAASNGESDVWYAASADGAQNWTPPVQVTHGGTAIFPVVAGGDRGVLDLAWYSTSANPATALTPGVGSQRPAADWYVDFARVTGAGTTRPAISTSRVSRRRIHRGNICVQGNACTGATADRSMRDFFSLALAPDGTALVAWPDNGQSTSGPVAPGNFSANHLVVARQTGGAGVYAGPVSVCGRTVGLTSTAVTPPLQAASPGLPTTITVPERQAGDSAIPPSVGWSVLVIGISLGVGELSARRRRRPRGKRN